MRSARSPNTTRTPAAQLAQRVRPRLDAAAAGLARTPNWMQQRGDHERGGVEAQGGPRADSATTRPPAAAPATTITRNVDWSTAAASA